MRSSAPQHAIPSVASASLCCELTRPPQSATSATRFGTARTYDEMVGLDDSHVKALDQSARHGVFRRHLCFVGTDSTRATERIGDGYTPSRTSGSRSRSNTLPTSTSSWLCGLWRMDRPTARGSSSSDARPNAVLVHCRAPFWNGLPVQNRRCPPKERQIHCGTQMNAGENVSARSHGLTPVGGLNACLSTSRTSSPGQAIAFLPRSLRARALTRFRLPSARS